MLSKLPKKVRAILGFLQKNLIIIIIIIFFCPFWKKYCGKGGVYISLLLVPWASHHENLSSSPTFLALLVALRASEKGGCGEGIKFPFQQIEYHVQHLNFVCPNY